MPEIQATAEHTHFFDTLLHIVENVGLRQTHARYHLDWAVFWAVVDRNCGSDAIERNINSIQAINGNVHDKITAVFTSSSLLFFFVCSEWPPEWFKHSAILTKKSNDARIFPIVRHQCFMRRLLRTCVPHHETYTF